MSGKRKRVHRTKAKQILKDKICTMLACCRDAQGYRTSILPQWPNGAPPKNTYMIFRVPLPIKTKQLVTLKDRVSAPMSNTGLSLLSDPLTLQPDCEGVIPLLRPSPGDGWRGEEAGGLKEWSAFQHGALEQRRQQGHPLQLHQRRGHSCICQVVKGPCEPEKCGHLIDVG